MDDVFWKKKNPPKFFGMWLPPGIYFAKFCSLERLKMTDFGLIYSHLSYGLRLSDSSSKYKFKSIFRNQQILLKLNPRDSCQDIFIELGVLTLASLYSWHHPVCLWCVLSTEMRIGQRLECPSEQNKGEGQIRIEQHKLTAQTQLVSDWSISFLEASGNSKLHKNSFKGFLKYLLVSKEFYFVD